MKQAADGLLLLTFGTILLIGAPLLLDSFLEWLEDIRDARKQRKPRRW